MFLGVEKGYIRNEWVKKFGFLPATLPKMTPLRIFSENFQSSCRANFLNDCFSTVIYVSVNFLLSVAGPSVEHQIT